MAWGEATCADGPSDAASILLFEERITLSICEVVN
jgi:hypothetical protein